MTKIRCFIEEYILTNLTQIEHSIVRYREQDIFGVGKNKKTYREIGESHGQTIGNICARAKRLREKKIPSKIRLLERKLEGTHVIVKDAKPGTVPMKQYYLDHLGEISSRTYNALLNYDSLLLDDILNTHAADLLKIINFGRESLKEVVILLHKNGLHLKVSSNPNHRQAENFVKKCITSLPNT